MEVGGERVGDDGLLPEQRARVQQYERDLRGDFWGKSAEEAKEEADRHAAVYRQANLSQAQKEARERGNNCPSDAAALMFFTTFALTGALTVATGMARRWQVR